MKNTFFSLLLALMLILGVMAVSATEKAVVSAGLCVLAERTDMAKTAILGENISFSKEDFLRSMNLKNIKEIEELAFRGCQSIDAVYIGGGIETVPLGAFFECYSLRKIHLDKNVKAIEDYAFAMCTDVENLYYTGCEEEIYNLAMSTGVYNEIFNGVHIDYKPTIEVTAENETKTKYTIEYIGVPIGETLICAEYQSGKLLNAKHGKLKDENVFEATNKNTNEIEIFVWEDFETAMPVCKSKSILVE